MLDRISEAWCKTMHSDAMWPIHGRYRCARCLREHRVEWDYQEADFVPAPELAETADSQGERKLSMSSTAAAVR